MMKLPDELHEAMVSDPGPVASMLMINHYASVVAKMPLQDIEGFRGRVPILYRYEMGLYPEGSAIRLYMEVRDRPDPYQLEVFLNPDSEADRDLLRELSDQSVLDIHFFGMDGEYVYSKRLQHRVLQRHELQELIVRAMNHLDDIRLSDRDWEAVKRQFQEDRPF